MKRLKKDKLDLSKEYLCIPVDFRGKALSNSALQVLSWIYGMYLNSDWVKISDTSLGDKLDLSRISILRAKQELQELGLIRVTSTPGGMSEYQVQVRRMAEFFDRKFIPAEEDAPANEKKHKPKKKKAMPNAKGAGMFKYECE